MTRLEKVMTALLANPSAQARFVNTLSLLEYIGARKIIKSQEEQSITLDTLSHAAEEIRHAFALKRLALKMSKGNLNTYKEEHLLCGESARNYIQNVDNNLAKILENHSQSQCSSSQAVKIDRELSTDFSMNVHTNYLLTTLLLEERAQVLYPFYEKVLSDQGYRGVLRGILNEEDAHLNYVQEKLLGISQPSHEGIEANSEAEKKLEMRPPLPGLLTEEKLSAMRQMEEHEFNLFLDSILIELEAQ